MNDNVQVGPHSFTPATRRDDAPNGDCAHCYLPRSHHPTHGYVPARPLGIQTDPYSRWLWRALFVIVAVLVIAAALKVIA